MLKIRLALELTRNMRLFLDVEAGVTGSGSRTARKPDSKAMTLPASPEVRPTTPEPAQRQRNGEARVPARAAGKPPRRRRSPDANTPMFFVVGHAKSGTSWLMRLLHSHPEILCRGEGKLFGKDHPHTLHGSLAHSKPFQTWLDRNPWTWQDRDPELEDIVRVVVEYLMAEKVKKAGKKVVGDKTPFMSPGVIEEIADILPGSKVIHIVRDGRDVAVSKAHHIWNNAEDKNGPHKLTSTQKAKRDAYLKDPGAFGISGQSIFDAGETAALARDWKTFVGRAIEDGPGLLDGDYYQLCYEDLLTEPVAQVREVLKFLGADSSEEVARACVEAVSFEKKAGRKPGQEDPTSFYRKGVSGDWKGVFTRGDRQAFKEEAGDLLIELGYEVDESW